MSVGLPSRDRVVPFFSRWYTDDSGVTWWAGSPWPDPDPALLGPCCPALTLPTSRPFPGCSASGLPCLVTSHVIIMSTLLDTRKKAAATYTISEMLKSETCILESTDYGWTLGLMSRLTAIALYLGGAQLKGAITETEVYSLSVTQYVAVDRQLPYLGLSFPFCKKGVGDAGLL